MKGGVHRWGGSPFVLLGPRQKVAHHLWRSKGDTSHEVRHLTGYGWYTKVVTCIHVIGDGPCPHSYIGDGFSCSSSPLLGTQVTGLIDACHLWAWPNISLWQPLLGQVVASRQWLWGGGGHVGRFWGRARLELQIVPLFLLFSPPFPLLPLLPPLFN